MSAFEKFKVEETGRGFGRVDFIDYYGSECSLQESSLACPAAIWFGIDLDFMENPRLAEKPDPPSGVHRMHLTQEQVRELLPFLTCFAETGLLPRRSK